jgi:MFS family permease
LKAQSVGIPLAIVPLSFALINLTYTISAYPIGWLSDRMSRKGLLFTGLGLFALTYTGLAIAQSPWQVWGLLALYGIHLGMTQGILLAMISERVSAELRGTAFGVLNLVVGVALFLASVLAGLLWQQVGTWAAFMLGTIGAIAAMLQLCFGDHTKS